MSHTLLLLLTFVASSLLFMGGYLLIYETLLRYRERAHRRFSDEFNYGGGEGEPSQLFKDLGIDYTASRRTRYWRSFQLWVEQAAMNVAPKTILIIGCSLAVGGIVAVALLDWRFSPLAGLVGFSSPLVFVHWKRRKRLSAICQQLPEAFDVMSRAVRSGQTVSGALQVIADEFPAPISEEFKQVYEQQNLGMTLEDALRNLAGRVSIMEMRICVVALLVQQKSGGNLVEVLKNLADTIRKRLRLRSRVKAITGEGRMQAHVLMALPILVLAAMCFVKYDYVEILFERPWLLVGTAFAQVIGAVWIHRVIHFDF